MDALLTTFLAAAFAEFGDKTQLLVVALGARYGRALPILLGIAVAALASSLIAATAGTLLHDLITTLAASLLVALALVFAGISGFSGRKAPEMGEGWKAGAFLTTLTCFFLLEFGDRTQFLTGALAARLDSLALAAAGATAGVLAANVPAVLLGDRFGSLLPLRPIRIGIACVFLLAGFIVTISTLRLI
jgi:Ca2+/H+ antiporter, TMEM165/GDT1 family